MSRTRRTDLTFGPEPSRYCVARTLINAVLAELSPREPYVGSLKIAKPARPHWPTLRLRSNR
jgi:hypothetical protein